MLKITTDENAQVLTLRLEGRLHGDWVPVLVECWRNAITRRGGRRVCIDLKDVTFVDADGKARLAEMHAQGAQLVCEDLETRALVAEICGGRALNSDGNGKVQPSGQQSVVSLTEKLSSLLRLQDELHAVNQELARASRPLKDRVELNDEQRQRIGSEIRAGLARWESVTERIAQVLGIQQNTTKAHRNEN